MLLFIKHSKTEHIVAWKIRILKVNVYYLNLYIQNSHELQIIMKTSETRGMKSKEK